MKTDGWFDYPETVPSGSPGQSIQTLLTSSFINLAILASITGLAILLDGWLDRSISLLDSWLAAAIALALAIVVWAIRGQLIRWPILTQRIIILVLSWSLSGVTFATAYPVNGTDDSLWLFLLVLMATSAFTVRPLLDQLTGLVFPIIAAIFMMSQRLSAELIGRFLLMAAIAGVFAFILAWFQLRQKLIALETIHLATAQRRQLEELTQRDPVTELYNDLAFKSRLGIELARSVRYKRPLSLLAFDLYENSHPLRASGRNHFELTIASLAAILNKKLRTTDILGCDKDGRFLVALPDTELTHAQIAANRIQVTIQNYNMDNSTRLTFCCGISEYHGETIESLILVTEARMREAFRLGPDQVVAE